MATPTGEWPAAGSGARSRPSSMPTQRQGEISCSGAAVPAVTLMAGAYPARICGYTRPAPMTRDATAAAGGTPTEREAFWFWLKLGMINFGGPAGQIAIMHDELVERRAWISE